MPTASWSSLTASSLSLSSLSSRSLREERDDEERLPVPPPSSAVVVGFAAGGSAMFGPELGHRAIMPNRPGYRCRPLGGVADRWPGVSDDADRRIELSTQDGRQSRDLLAARGPGRPSGLPEPDDVDPTSVEPPGRFLPPRTFTVRGDAAFQASPMTGSIGGAVVAFVETRVFFCPASSSQALWYASSRAA